MGRRIARVSKSPGLSTTLDVSTGVRSERLAPILMVGWGVLIEEGLDYFVVERGGCCVEGM